MDLVDIPAEKGMEESQQISSLVGEFKGLRVQSEIQLPPFGQWIRRM